jgi:hypothetical protein
MRFHTKFATALRDVQTATAQATLEAFGLQKLARTKFLEMMDKGLLSPADMARLNISKKLPGATGRAQRKLTRQVRGNLYYAGTDLAQKGLARHQALKGALTPQIVNRHGAFVDDLGGSPAAATPGGVFMDNNAKDLFEKAHRLPRKSPQAHNTIAHAAAEHELAESAMLRGAGYAARQQGELTAARSLAPETAAELNAYRKELTEAGAPELAARTTLLQPKSQHSYEAKPFASHFGPAALIAETHSTFRDPAAARYYETLRSREPGERFVRQKMKQFGHTHAYPLPLGGKQHFALEEAAAGMPLDLIHSEALNRRLNSIPNGIVPKGLAASVAAKHKEISDLVAKGFFDAEIAAPILNRLRSEMKSLQEREGVRTLPYANRQDARRALMALFSALRNDANPGVRV